MQTVHRYHPFIKSLLLFLLAATVVFIPLASPAVVAAESSYTLLDPDCSSALTIDAKAFVLYDAQSGTFLTGKDQDKPLAPASVTKVMTVLLAMENLDLTDTIIVTPEMFETIPNDYTRLGLLENEEITVEQALYASLLISANDASMALAIAVGGTIDNFVAMMNSRAAELGCRDTHFTNPYGFADTDHLTTAHDIALIFAEVLKHDLYTKIATTRHYLMPATNVYAEERGMQNGSKFVITEQFSYEYFIGGKTGYTDLSSYTITAGARRDGRTLISVILGATQSAIRYSGCISLFDYGFDKFSTIAVDPAGFQTVKDDAVADVTAAIGQTGSTLIIDDVRLQLEEYLTTTAARAASSYDCVIDARSALLQADLADQVLQYPLYLEYSDGTRFPVGLLEINVSLAPTEVTTVPETPGSESSVWRTVLRIIAIILLILVIAFCLLILLLMIRHDQQKKRRRKSSRRR